MNMQFDLFIYLAVVVVLAAFVLAAIVLLKRTPDAKDLETRKIRFAAVMFTGILTLFLFVAMLYFGAADGSGNQQAAREIFDKAATAMTPLAGVIIGYIFGTRQNRKPE
jgi:amino acid transporter